MCLILIGYQVHPDYPLVVAANRDEFFERPAQAAHYWQDAPSVLAGRDLQQGGSWLGVDLRGRFAAVTNYREPSRPKAGTISRGLLVSGFLQGSETQHAYLSAVDNDRTHYDEFNLFTYWQDALCFYSSRQPSVRQLPPAIYGLSNGHLDAPWPKVVQGKEALARVLAVPGPIDEAPLLALLADKSIPADTQLPDTGVGIEWERLLAPIFVNAGEYGTRASTVVMFTKAGRIQFIEQSYDKLGNSGAINRFEINL